MITQLLAPRSDRRPGPRLVRLAGPRVTRRGVEIVLGLLWVLDGLLQFQPTMLTTRFATQVIGPAAHGPWFVSGPIREAARIIAQQPALFDTFFGVIQLALGAGILYHRTARWALGASVAWALSVWYLGEGLGGLFGSGASTMTGAPGAALLYAVLALIVSPWAGGKAGGRRPARLAAMAWASLWVGGAVLQLLPGCDTNACLRMALAMNTSGAPAWFAAIGNHLSALVPSTGVSIVADLAALQAMVGLGALRPGRVRTAAVVAGIGLAAAYWVAGQDMGQFWSGISTDPNSGPLVALLGLAVLGSRSWPQAAGEGQRDAWYRKAIPLAKNAAETT